MKSLERLSAFPTQPNFSHSASRAKDALFIPFGKDGNDYSLDFWLRATDREIQAANSIVFGIPQPLQITKIAVGINLICIATFDDKLGNTRLILYELSSGKSRHIPDISGMVDCLLFAAEYNYIIFHSTSGNGIGRIKVDGVMEGEFLVEYFPVKGNTLAATGHFILVGSDDILHVYDASSAQLLSTINVELQVSMITADSLAQVLVFFVLSAETQEFRCYTYSPADKDPVELLFSFNLNVAGVDLDAQWKLKQCRIIDESCTVFLTSDGRCRFVSVDLETGDRNYDLMIETITQIFDFYHVQNKSVLYILSFVGVWKLDCGSDETVSSTAPLLIEDLLLQMCVREEISKFYQQEEGKILEMRKKHLLIIDELLKQFQINPDSFFPPISEDHLLSLVKTILEHDDYHLEQKIALLFYIVHPVDSAFGDKIGLLSKQSQTLIKAYHAYDQGQYTFAIQLFEKGEDVDFPDLIVKGLSACGSRDDLRDFLQLFPNKICENIFLLAEFDLQKAYEIALKSRSLLPRLMDAVFAKKKELELCRLAVDRRFGEFLEDNLDKAEYRKFYGLFLLTRARFVEAKKYIPSLQANVSDVDFIPQMFNVVNDRTFIPSVSGTRTENSVSNDLHLVDYQPNRFSNSRSVMLKRSGSINKKLLSPFSSPKAKVVPVVEIPVSETSFTDPVVVMPSKRKELLEKEYLFSSRKKSPKDKVEFKPKSPTKGGESDNVDVDEEEEDDDVFHDQSIHLEAATPSNDFNKGTVFSPPIDRTPAATETGGWLGRISNWLTPFKLTQEKRVRTGSSDAEMAVERRYKRFDLAEEDESSGDDYKNDEDYIPQDYQEDYSDEDEQQPRDIFSEPLDSVREDEPRKTKSVENSPRTKKTPGKKRNVKLSKDSGSNDLVQPRITRSAVKQKHGSTSTLSTETSQVSETPQRSVRKSGVKRRTGKKSEHGTNTRRAGKKSVEFLDEEIPTPRRMITRSMRNSDEKL